MTKIFDEIREERRLQNQTWGEQNHSPVEWIAILTEEVSEAAQEAAHSHFQKNNVIKSISLTRYRQELIQVAAVAVQMIECLDRNNYYKS